MSLMRRGALFAGALFAGALFGSKSTEFPHGGRARRHPALPPYMPPIPLIRPRTVEDDEAFFISVLL